MSLARVRFTVRRMMVAVAIAAIALGWTVILDRGIESDWGGPSEIEVRRQAFERQAAYREAERVSSVAYLWNRYVYTNRRGHMMSDASVRANDWHVALAEKYRAAARYPWLPVVPDPPEPE